MSRRYREFVGLGETIVHRVLEGYDEMQDKMQIIGEDFSEDPLNLFEDLKVEQPDNVEMGAPRVRLKWATPDGDDLVAHMARVSNTKANLGDPGAKLIGFLIRNHHWSPFEMVNMCLEIHTERDISAQILRHSKEFRFQEFSTRYAEVEDLRWSTECRFQDIQNRQNSISIGQVDYGQVMMDNETRKPIKETLPSVNGYPMEETVSYFDAVVNETRVRSLEAYRELLERGVAKECARRVLPIGLMPTVMYINSNLRGWIHYLAERTKPGVQKEHREIALAVEPHFAEHFPQVWEAVLAYREAQTRKDAMAATMEQLVSMYDPSSIFSEAPFMNLIHSVAKDYGFPGKATS